MEPILKVAAFTGGGNVASARFRVRQYVSALGALGIAMHEFPAPLGSFPPATRWVRPAWVPASLAARLPGILASCKYDITLLQREMISTMCTLESWTHSPRVLDVDDAIFLHRGGKPARKIAERCAGIICGNAFLAEFFQFRPVAIVPTAVDTQQFKPASIPADDTVTLGWTGAASAYPELYDIEPALAAVLREHPNVRLRILADRPPQFSTLAPNRVEFIPWSPQAEMPAIQGMSIGLMPLRDSLWNRGKCSYKMLLYMACGRPALVSPVGMNQEVLALGDGATAATDFNQWREQLNELIRHADKVESMGHAARATVVEHFALEPIAKRLAAALRGFK